MESENTLFTLNIGIRMGKVLTIQQHKTLISDFFIDWLNRFYMVFSTLLYQDAPDTLSWDGGIAVLSLIIKSGMSH